MLSQQSVGWRVAASGAPTAGGDRIVPQLDKEKHEESSDSRSQTMQKGWILFPHSCVPKRLELRGWLVTEMNG